MNLFDYQKAILSAADRRPDSRLKYGQILIAGRQLGKTQGLIREKGLIREICGDSFNPIKPTHNYLKLRKSRW